MPKSVKQPKHVNLIHARTHKQGKELIEGEHTTSRDRKIAEIIRDLETGKVKEFDELSQEFTCRNGNKCMVGEDGIVTNLETGEQIGVGKNCCDDKYKDLMMNSEGSGVGKRRRTRKARKGKKSRRKGKKSRRKARKGKQSRRKGRKRRRRRTKKH